MNAFKRRYSFGSVIIELIFDFLSRTHFFTVCVWFLWILTCQFSFYQQNLQSDWLWHRNFHIRISSFVWTLFDEKIELIRRVMSSTILTIRTTSNTLESFAAILNSIDVMNYACVFSVRTIYRMVDTHLLNRFIQQQQQQKNRIATMMNVPNADR